MARAGLESAARETKQVRESSCNTRWSHSGLRGLRDGDLCICCFLQDSGAAVVGKGHAGIL